MWPFFSATFPVLSVLASASSTQDNAKQELINSVSQVASRFMDAVSALSEPLFAIGIVLAAIAAIMNIGKGILKAAEIFLIVLAGAFILSHLHEIYTFLSSIIFGKV